MNIHRVAFLHIEPRLGRIEYNQQLIETAISQATAGGARWIVTPELCTSGYYFAEQIGTGWISPQPDSWMKRLLKISKRHGLTIFLSHPERDSLSDRLFNSVFVLGADGKLAGRHRKTGISDKLTAESCFSRGNELAPIDCDGIKVGILICADAWRPEIAATLKQRGADLFISPAAWPPQPCGPEGCWEKRTAETGIPIWVCNRTGIERELNYTQAESIVAGNGQRLLQISLDRAAILFFDWDMETMSPLSGEFEVAYLDEEKLSD